MAAAQRFFSTAELLEQALLHLPLRTLYLAQRVNSTFLGVVLGSSMIQRALWARSAVDYSIEWKPERLDVNGEETSHMSSELSVWHVVGKPVATRTPILNPFLTMFRNTPSDYELSHFKVIKNFSLDLPSEHTHTLIFNNDGFCRSRLDVAYRYGSDQVMPQSSHGVEDMLLTQPPCSSIHLLHRSQDPQEGAGDFWKCAGVRKAEFDICASTGVKVGMLLKGMVKGAPSIDDQDGVERPLRPRRAPFEAAIRDACNDWWAKRTSSIGGSEVVDNNPAQPDTPDNAPDVARSFIAEYAILGGLKWQILQSTVDVITGWDMLGIFDMSEKELKGLDRIQ
ncbi:hypothetical protein LTR17_023204 [Elasticomyces elasticus]|nr:hypothetical protein LTR17_023204 [Elasticomyces elasticus]